MRLLTRIRPATWPRERDAKHGVDAEEWARVLQVREHSVEQVDDVARDAEKVVRAVAVAARRVAALAARGFEGIAHGKDAARGRKVL
jgi:hypothetical protein